MLLFHSILKNISFQKKRKQGREGWREERRKGESRGRGVIIVFLLGKEKPRVSILFNIEEFFLFAHILVMVNGEDGASVLCLFTHFPFVLSDKLVKQPISATF